MEPKKPNSNNRQKLPAEWKVVTIVVIALAFTELLLSRTEKSLSKDVAHLASFDSIIHRLSSSPPDVKRILFVGNSLVREGIRPDAIAESVPKERMSPFAIERIHPDNTALSEWYYAIDRFVLEPHRKIDAIVIGFQGGHLRDAPSRHLERLRRYYCGRNQTLSLLTYDINSFEGLAYFTINGSSSAICNRDRVERKVLSELIPNYQEGIQQLNRNQPKLKVSESEVSYRRLRDLIHRLQSQQIAVVLAEIPVPEPIPIDQELRSLAAEFSVQLIDCQALAPLPIGSYPDGLHMNSEAADLYSRYLASQLNWERLNQPR